MLYYVYGPNILYEYARGAGKAFGTYGPIVKDVAFDVYNEFTEFLEENREFELLRKQGVDISDMPRKTTNIIERFQEAYEGFTDMTSNTKETEELQKAYGQVAQFFRFT